MLTSEAQELCRSVMKAQIERQWTRKQIRRIWPLWEFMKIRKIKRTSRHFRTVALAVSVVERYRKWSGGMFPPPSEYSIDCFVENTLHDQTKEYQAKARKVLVRLIRKA